MNKVILDLFYEEYPKNRFLHGNNQPILQTFKRKTY